MEKSLYEMVRAVADATIGPSAQTIQISMDKNGGIRVSGRVVRYVTNPDAMLPTSQLDPR